MSKIIKTVSIWIVLATVFFSVYAKTDIGLIQKDKDTLSTTTGGFDFNVSRVCLLNESNCKPHVYFIWDAGRNAYLLFIENLDGLYMDTGKTNLDSIKYSPPDSILRKHLINGGGLIFRIKPDSLRKCIGNSYIFKNAPDPRDNIPYYAKLRIKDFVVRDSAQHQVDMVFIWACNVSGHTDLRTSGLDVEGMTIAGDGRGIGTEQKSVVARGPAGFRVVVSLRGGGVVLKRDRQRIIDLSGRNRNH